MACELSKQVIKGKVDTPFFSIVIPTYNRKKELSNAIHSALNQKNTDIPYEIIIVDNKPFINENETHLDLIRSFHSEKIYYYVNYENIGGCKNWNQGYNLARGKWIILLHDDDLLLDNYLETLNYIIKKYDNVDAITFPALVRNRLLNTERIDFTLKRTGWIKPIYFMLSNVCNVVGLSIKKEVWIKSGGFNESYLPIIDYELWYRISVNYNFLYYSSDKPCTVYNIEYNDSTNPATIYNLMNTCNRLQFEIAKKQSKFVQVLFKHSYNYEVNLKIKGIIDTFLKNIHDEDCQLLFSLRRHTSFIDKICFFILSKYILTRNLLKL